MLNLLMILAQAPEGNPNAPGIGSMLFPLVLMGGIFYFILIRPQSKEKRRRADMLSGMKKNDRVVTIGGVLGTITSVRDDEVTLKVDESNNTKITFSRASIQRILGSSGPDADAKS
jgi:preprotein translocase subunit YajC